MTAETAGFIAAQRTDHCAPHAVACRALGVRPRRSASTSTGPWPISSFAGRQRTPRWSRRSTAPRAPTGRPGPEPGFAASDHYPTAEPANAAVNTAVATRGGNIKGAIFHTDKGSQYTAGAFANPCRRLGIARSAGRTGNALDNAPAESFFSTLTHELIDRRAWTTKAQARQKISLWVHTWYNHHRPHSAIGMIPPVEYELACTPDPHNQPLHD